MGCTFYYEDVRNYKKVVCHGCLEKKEVYSCYKGKCFGDSKKFWYCLDCCKFLRAGLSLNSLRKIKKIDARLKRV